MAPGAGEVGLCGEGGGVDVEDVEGIRVSCVRGANQGVVSHLRSPVGPGLLGVQVLPSVGVAYVQE